MSGKGLRIGLTGSIGTGKSRVAELFKAHGAWVIDADQIGRLILEPGKKGWQALQAAFGERFFNSNQTVDRQKLRSAIFTDRTLRTELDKLLHPLIRQEIELACQEEAELTVVEIPLLYETGWQEDFELVVVVAADDQRCLSRIMARDGVSRPEAEQALAAQMTIKEKTALADHVIDNNGAWSDTVRQFDNLINKLSVG